MRLFDYVIVSDRCEVRQHPTLWNKCVCAFWYGDLKVWEVVYTKRYIQNSIPRFSGRDIRFFSVDSCIKVDDERRTDK